MACSLQSGGQTGDSTATDTRQSYRDRLKAATSDSSQNATSWAEDSQTDYKQALRHLAEGDEVGINPNNLSSKSEPAHGGRSFNQTSVQVSTSGGSSTKDPVEDLPRIQPDAMHPVSLQTPGAQQLQ